MVKIVTLLFNHFINQFRLFFSLSYIQMNTSILFSAQFTFPMNIPVQFSSDGLVEDGIDVCKFTVIVYQQEHALQTVLVYTF